MWAWVPQHKRNKVLQPLVNQQMIESPPKPREVWDNWKRQHLNPWQQNNVYSLKLCNTYNNVQCLDVEISVVGELKITPSPVHLFCVIDWWVVITTFNFLLIFSSPISQSIVLFSFFISIQHRLQKQNPCSSSIFTTTPNF